MSRRPIRPGFQDDDVVLVFKHQNINAPREAIRHKTARCVRAATLRFYGAQVVRAAFPATHLVGDKEPTTWGLTMPERISSGDTALASPELLVNRIHEITCEIHRLREERTASPVRLARELLSGPYRAKRLKRHLQACAMAR